MMTCRFLLHTFLSVLLVSSINLKTISLIQNASLDVSNLNTTTINGTCDQCLCMIHTSFPWISSFNCLHNTGVCQLFSQPFIRESSPIMINLASSFYILTSPHILYGSWPLFTSSNDIVYGLWQMKAGENGTLSVAGTSMGNFYLGETPASAFDQNNNTKYTSFGYCNDLLFTVTCGVDTGLYLTLKYSATLLKAFGFRTANTWPSRDPMSVTIEESKINSSLLLLGSSWTLIYNGSSGLNDTTTDFTYGLVQNISNNLVAFSSYRILITSIRHNSTAVQYGEVELFSA